MRLRSVLLFSVLLSASVHAQERGLAIQQAPAGGDAPAGTTYALIVGISAYEHFTPLKYADKDASLFRDYAKSKAGGSVTADNMLYLVNEDAKGGTLNIRALAWIENRPYAAGDKLYIYLAGHGDAIDEDEYFFLGSDLSVGGDGAKNNYRAGFALQMYNLKMSIKRVAAKGVQVVLIMDACRTNELAGGQDGQKMFTAGIMNSGINAITMLAAGPGQSAIENDKIGGGHGIFTWYLVDGLSGEADKDASGKIDLYELTSYVKDNVRSEAMKQFKHQQSPDFSGFKDDTKTFAIVDAAYHTAWVSDKKLTKAIASAPAVAQAGERGAEANKDSILINTYNLFAGALKAHKLTGTNSAADYYKRMVMHNANAPLTDDARYTLAGEYLNYAQGKINIYLSGRDASSQAVYEDAVSGTGATGSSAQAKYRLVSAVPFGLAADMLDSAMTLLQDNKALVADLQPKYLFLRAKSFFERKAGGISYEEAMLAIQKAISLQPSAAYLHNVLGNLYMEKKNYDAAVTAYNNAIKLNGTWAYPWNNLGSLYYERSQFADAETFYRKATKMDSTNIDSWNTLGLVLYRQNKFADAEKAYRKALTIDATSTKVLSNLGVLYSDQNKLAEAELIYKRTVAIDSMDAYAWDGLGYIYHQQKKYTDAEYHYRRALAIDSLHATSWNNLGVLYYVQNKLTEAEHYYKRAIAVDPDDVNGWSNLGSLYFGQKRYADAQQYFVKACEIDPADANRLYNLGCAFALTNDKDKCIYYLDQCLYRGYRNINNLNQNPDLNNVRGTPEYRGLMSKYFGR